MSSYCPELMTRYNSWKQAVGDLRTAYKDMLSSGKGLDEQKVTEYIDKIQSAREEYIKYTQEEVGLEWRGKIHKISRIEAEAVKKITERVKDVVVFEFYSNHVSEMRFFGEEPTQELIQAVKMCSVFKGCYLYLKNLESAKGFKFPQSIKELHLNGLTSAEGLELPQSIEYLSLDGLTSAEGLELPQSIEYLSLDGLTSAKKLVLPQSIERLYLNGLTSAEGLELPQSIKKLSLNGLTSIDIEDFELPQSIKVLSLDGLSSAEGLELPQSIEYLSLDGITSAEGLELPQSVKYLWVCRLSPEERNDLRRDYPHLIIVPTP